jgi:hypothetical protein
MTHPTHIYIKHTSIYSLAISIIALIHRIDLTSRPLNLRYNSTIPPSPSRIILKYRPTLIFITLNTRIKRTIRHIIRSIFHLLPPQTYPLTFSSSIISIKCPYLWTLLTKTSLHNTWSLPWKRYKTSHSTRSNRISQIFSQVYS